MLIDKEEDLIGSLKGSKAKLFESQAWESRALTFPWTCPA